MSEVIIDRPLAESEWEALRDPDGGRYEVLDGRLVVSPSGDGDHNQVVADLAHLLRRAVARAGLDLTVTSDVLTRGPLAEVGLVRHRCGLLHFRLPG